MKAKKYKKKLFTELVTLNTAVHSNVHKPWFRSINYKDGFMTT